MPFNIGALGNFDLVISGCFEEEKDGQLVSTNFVEKVKRIDVPTGLEILSNCPISFGQIDGKHEEDLGKERVAELRKKEHEYLIEKIKPFVSETFAEKLKFIPYIRFIGMVDYMLTGEELGETNSRKIIEALNKLRENIEAREKELKKKLETGKQSISL